MDVTGVLERHGGLSTRAALIAATSRADVDRALREKSLVRVGQGRYTSPDVGEAPALAHGMRGVLCLTSAALHHGWEVKVTPEPPHVCVPRKRNVRADRRAQVQLHRADLGPDDTVDGIATGRELTLLHCLRSLPDDEALCVADSALRSGEHQTLRAVRASVRGAGAAKVRRIADAARGEAANPFESCMRAIALTVPGLHMVPQVVISSPRVWAQTDLADVDIGLVVECESFEWHAKRPDFRKDVRRYTLLVADGWTVLRFIWEDVMHRPHEVRAVVERTVARLSGDARTDVSATWPVAA